jgi:hypothetical protein
MMLNATTNRGDKTMRIINLTSAPVTLSSLRHAYRTHLLVSGETEDTLTFPAWRIRQRKLEQKEAATLQSYNEENAKTARPRY